MHPAVSRGNLASVELSGVGVEASITGHLHFANDRQDDGRDCAKSGRERM